MTTALNPYRDHTRTYSHTCRSLQAVLMLRKYVSMIYELIARKVEVVAESLEMKGIKDAN